MFIILSQKIDTESSYSDQVYSTYHYPSRYKNQIHEGDTFVYYQGNRYVKEQRYYFGTGTVGRISSADGENYYAELHNVSRFKKIVPIYLSGGKYVEQLGFETVRKSPTPPWQSSIRPLSEAAYNYILAYSGEQITVQMFKPVDELKENLKQKIRAFYLENRTEAIIEIRDISSQLADALFGPRKE